MALAITYSRASLGMDAPLITVETHISNGLPRLSIVGLPETAVKESKDRVRSAILNSNFEFPTRRITINLAPAELPKYGSRYDLAIAIGILSASNQIPSEALSRIEFIGELALTGELRAVPEILAGALSIRKANHSLILPLDNCPEASLIDGIELLPARTLLEVCSHLTQGKQLLPFEPSHSKMCNTPDINDLKWVKGQYQAKRALEIAAAGRHSILLIGPPGVGKTFLSHCMTGILPPLTEEEAIEAAMMRSLSGRQIIPEEWLHRPFRSPHHSSSSYALIGGGNPLKPGEISLAHHGILFLDELPEFKRQTLESLREPLESGQIMLSRACHQATYPAKFQLIAAMNPCPCGHHGNALGECTCSPEAIRKYQARISGPLLDRIDIQAELQAIPMSLLHASTAEIESSEEVLSRVTQARTRQLQRVNKLNATYTVADITEHCQLQTELVTYLEDTCQQLKMTARSSHKILKIARTLADLDNCTTILKHHIKEAFSYRFMDRSKIM